jgi:lipopolysaccharide/colanic/teichoic acid biosynthesis glycosyltransferase
LIEDNEKLYEVIISNSKVIASPMGSDDEEENSNHMKASEFFHSSEKLKRTNQSFKSAININFKVFYIAVSFLLIILIYLTINTDRPRSLKRPGKERKKKH